MASGKKGGASRIAVWIILILLIVGLAGFGATNFGGSVSSIGTVGKTPIDVQRYARELQQQMSAFSAQTGQNMTLAQAQQFGIDRAVLQQLVSTVALENEAAELGLSVGDAQVRNAVLEIQAFQGLDGTFDREAYSFALDRAGLNEEQFENNLRSEMARTLVQGAVSGGVEAPAPFVDTLFAFVAERRDFDWAMLGADALPAPVADPGDADLRAYYDAHTDEFMLPETRDITYAWVTPDMIVGTIPGDDEALRRLYDARIDEFVTPERRLVERLIFLDSAAAAAAKVEIDAGTKRFEDLVAERDLSLADIDLGDVTEADLGSAGAAVFALTEPGVVGPVDTDLGPALMRMNAILPAQETSFEDARPELLDEYHLDAARRAIGDQIEQFDDLLAGGATLEELAGETEMELGQIDWTTGSSDGIAGYDAFREAAAAAQVGDFPEAVELDDGGLFALRVNEIVETRLQPFGEARDKTETGWRAQATAAALTEQAQAFVDQLESGTAADDLGLALQAETGITRESFVPGTPPDFLEQVFAMQPGQVRVIEGENAAYIMRLTAIAPPDTEDADNAARLERFAESTAQALGSDILQAYTRAIEAQAGISLNQTAINAVHTQFP